MNRKEFIKGLGTVAGAESLLFAAGCGEAGGESAADKAAPTFLQLAKARFSVRYYAKTPVEQEKIDAILEAARVAPTAKNLQPFHIYVLKSQDALAKINRLSRCAYEAPVVFIVCYDRSKAWQSPFDAGDNSGVMDTSIVGTHMMLEATAQGLGSCWVKFFDPKEVAARVKEMNAALSGRGGGRGGGFKDDLDPQGCEATQDASYQWLDGSIAAMNDDLAVQREGRAPVQAFAQGTPAVGHSRGAEMPLPLRESLELERRLLGSRVPAGKYRSVPPAKEGSRRADLVIEERVLVEWLR